MARKLTDTVKLQVRLSERLRRRLEQEAKHSDWSMNTEIVSRLDTSFQEKEQEKLIAVAIGQAATATAGRLRQEFQEFWQWIRAQEATKHPAPPDKEESNRSEGPSP